MRCLKVCTNTVILYDNANIKLFFNPANSSVDLRSFWMIIYQPDPKYLRRC